MIPNHSEQRSGVSESLKIRRESLRRRDHERPSAESLARNTGKSNVRGSIPSGAELWRGDREHGHDFPRHSIQTNRLHRN